MNAGSCPRENRQLAVSLADLMIKWEAHGRERIRARRAAAAAEAAAATAAAAARAAAVAAEEAAAAAAASVENSEGGDAQGSGTKRPLAGTSEGAQVGIGVGKDTVPQQGRDTKLMRTESGAVPGTGSSMPRPSLDLPAAGAIIGGGVAVAEGTTDNFTLNRSSVRICTPVALCGVRSISNSRVRMFTSRQTLLVRVISVPEFSVILQAKVGKAPPTPHRALGRTRLCILLRTGHESLGHILTPEEDEDGVVLMIATMITVMTMVTRMLMRAITSLTRTIVLQPQQQVETVVNFLVRVALFAMANLKDSNIAHLSKQCMRLLESALTLWPDTPIKYT